MTRLTRRPRSSQRLNILTFAIACIALFSAVGGPSYAATALKKSSVKSKHIVDGQVKSADLRDGDVRSVDLLDGDVGLLDLSAAAKAQLQSILDGSVTTSKLADGAVTTPKLADNVVTSPKVADGSIGSADVANNTLTNDDLAGNSVGAVELASNTVQGDEVENGSLDGVDIGKASGTVSLDFTPIPAQDCELAAPDVAGATTSDQVTVSPEAGFNPASSPVVIYGQASSVNGEIVVVACNVSAAAVDLPSTTFHYTVIDN